MGQSHPIQKDDYPDLWGLTANEVANRNSKAQLSLHEYHIDQDEGSQTEVRSIESVAFYPLHLLLNDSMPFNYTVKADNANPQAYLSVFHNSIKLYQLYTFYVYAINELGSIHGEKILELQSKHLDKWLGEQQGIVLSARFDDITNAAKHHIQHYASNYDYLNLDIPVENSISKTFLLGNRESPLHDPEFNQFTPSDVNFRGVDLALAEHLGTAKDLALQVYSRYFGVVIVKI